MLYRTLFVVCMSVQICLGADSPSKRRSRVTPFSPPRLREVPSPKRQGAIAAAAIREGSVEDCERTLMAIENPKKKLSYFDANLGEGGRGALSTPMQLCIDTIFARPTDEKLPLVGVLASFLQRSPDLLTTKCYRAYGPFDYAASKLTPENRTEAFVPHLFTLLAQDTLQTDILHLKSVRTIALYLMQGDPEWYKKARDILLASPKMIRHLNVALAQQGHENVLNFMFMHESPARVAQMSVKDVYAHDNTLAYVHLERFLAHQTFKSSPDAQCIKNDLLFWAAQTAASPLLEQCLLVNLADPYSVQKVGDEVVTPIERALQTVLDNPSHAYALPNLVAMLEVSKRKSACCQLPSYNDWYEVVRERMQERLGQTFANTALKPFSTQFAVWERVLVNLCDPKELVKARSLIMPLLSHGKADAPMSISFPAGASLFKQFVLAMQIEKFCRLMAYTLRTQNAIDMHGFLQTGSALAHEKADFAKYYRQQAQSIFMGLKPETQEYINAIDIARCLDTAHIMMGFTPHHPTSVPAASSS